MHHGAIATAAAGSPAATVAAGSTGTIALELSLEQAFETFQLKRGLAIDARTSDCHWHGERMDCDTAGWLLGQAAMREASDASASSR